MNHAVEILLSLAVILVTLAYLVLVCYRKRSIAVISFSSELRFKDDAARTSYRNKVTEDIAAARKDGKVILLDNGARLDFLDFRS